MKLKFIVNTIEKLFGLTYNGDGCRADMYLPDRLLAMSLIFFAAGLGCGVYSFFKFSLITVIIAFLGIILGVFSLLCWKNQTITMISDKEFIYSTMFGKKHTYSFSDIQYLRINRDSMTLFVENKKIHIESMAVLSDRLIDTINNALENKRPVYSCSHVIDESQPILYVLHDEDGDWQFLCGQTHETIDARVVALEEIIKFDSTIRDIIFLKEGQAAERGSIDDDWKIL